MGKVNVADNFELAAQYGVNTLPRVLIFQGSDQPVEQVVGLASEHELTQLLDRLLQP